MPIEDLWRQLAGAQEGEAQVRVDAVHPHAIYADFQPPDQVGLVVVCAARPPMVQPMRAVLIEQGLRSDGRWTLRLSLQDKRLRPVFVALCDDIIACTRSGVVGSRLGQVVVERIVHWRELLQRDTAGLGEMALRGLIGELLVLRDRVLPEFGPVAAIGAWRGPSGAPQDFLLPDGRHLEVKTATPHADRLHINGLAQLDAGNDPLSLVLVRGEIVSPASNGAVTAPALIKELHVLLSCEPELLIAFGAALSEVGWHEHESHDAVALRVVKIEDHEVGPDFPRLTRGTVPMGILGADYVIALPTPYAGRGEEGL